MTKNDIINGTPVSSEGSGVVQLGQVCIRNLVTNEYVITSEHCPITGGTDVTNGAQSTTIDWLLEHPSLDVTLVHLKQACEYTRPPLYRDWVLSKIEDTGLWQFNVTPNAAFFGYNTEVLNGVTPQDALVGHHSREWCKFYDYSKANSICDLSDENATDVGGLNFNYAGNPREDQYDLIMDETMDLPFDDRQIVFFV